MSPKEVRMKEDFLKKNNNYIFLFTLFFCTFFTSYTQAQKSFVCWNEQKTEAIAFAFDDTLNYVTVRDIHRYSTFKSRKEQLQSHMPGGTHKLQMDTDFITLEFIQDTASAKTQLSTGEFIKSNTEITEEEYLKQTRYHAVYPNIHKYTFDKNLLKLSLSYSPLPKPRYSSMAKYVYDQKTDEYHFKKIRELTDKEFSTIFPPHEKSNTYSYPNCEEDSGSLKQTIRSILKHLTFP